MFRATVIANYFVVKGNEEGVSVTPLKLNKLVFIAHGFFLATTNTPLIREQVEAWQYGPVVRSLYLLYKHKGERPILRPEFPDRDAVLEYHDLFSVSNHKVKKLLDAVWTGYGTKDALTLSAISHKPGSPWDSVWNHIGGKINEKPEIPNAIIREYYVKILKPEGNTAHQD